MSASASREVQQLEMDNESCWMQLEQSKTKLEILLARANDTAEELRKFVRMGFVPKTLNALNRAIAICEDRRVTDKPKRRRA